jgi:tetratricopeptide (TPR) repeat protein
MAAHRALRWTAAALAFVARTAAAQDAPAPPTSEPADPARVREGDPLRADALFQEAIALSDQGRWQEACAKFRESLAAEPSVGTLLNVAACSVREGDERQAAREYRRVLELNVGTSDPDRKRNVAASARAALQKLEAELAAVTVRITPADAAARIVIDDKRAEIVRVGEAAELEPGKHVITVDAPGFRQARREIELAPGARDLLVITLEPASAAEPAAAAPPSGPRSLATAGWVTGLAGSAVLATGAALIAVAADRAAEIRSECGPDAAPPVCPLGSAEVADALASEGRAFEISGYVGLGVGGAAVATGISLLIADAVGANDSVHISPRVSASEVGVWLVERF